MGQKLTSPAPSHGRQAIRAAKRGEVDLLLAVLYESPLAASCLDHNGYTPVHHAARQGHCKALEAVAYVIKHEAARLLDSQRALADRPDGDASGSTSLTACPHQVLLQQLVNRKTSKGLTPLMLACKEGHAEVVTLLLSLGANPLLVERQRQRSCLHFAASKGHADCVRALFGSPVMIQDQTRGRQVSLADVLVTEGNPNARFFRFIDLRTSTGYSALHFACCFGHLEVIKALLQAGASLSVRTSNNSSSAAEIHCCTASTPLHLATVMGNGNAVLMLLEGQVMSSEQMLPSRRQGAARLDWEGNRQQDIRLMLDSHGDSSHRLAVSLGYRRIAAVLDPSIPILSVMRLRTPTLGIPSLKVLAQTALHEHLLSWLDVFEAEAEEAVLSKTAAPSAAATSAAAVGQHWVPGNSLIGGPLYHGSSDNISVLPLVEQDVDVPVPAARGRARVAAAAATTHSAHHAEGESAAGEEAPLILLGGEIKEEEAAEPTAAGAGTAAATVGDASNGGESTAGLGGEVLSTSCSNSTTLKPMLLSLPVEVLLMYIKAVVEGGEERGAADGTAVEGRLPHCQLTDQLEHEQKCFEPAPTAVAAPAAAQGGWEVAGKEDPRQLEHKQTCFEPAAAAASPSEAAAQKGWEVPGEKDARQLEHEQTCFEPAAAAAASPAAAAAQGGWEMAGKKDGCIVPSCCSSCARATMLPLDAHAPAAGIDGYCAPCDAVLAAALPDAVALLQSHPPPAAAAATRDQILQVHIEAVSAGTETSAAAVPAAGSSPPGNICSLQEGARALHGNSEGKKHSSAVPTAAQVAAAAAAAAVAPAVAAVAEDEASTCGVCLDESCSVVLMPCRHQLCLGCCRTLVESCRKPTGCPFCRQYVSGFKPVPGS